MRLPAIAASRCMIAVGVGSAASYHLNPTNMQGLSSVFQIGIAYAVGVLLAFIVSITLFISYNCDENVFCCTGR